MTCRQVVHFNTHDAAGGAAIAARRLHVALQDLGVPSRMLVREARSGDPTVTVAPPASARKRAWRRVTRRAALGRYRLTRDPRLEIFSDDRSELGVEVLGSLAPSDLVHLHWVADLVDHRSFFPALGRDRPLVWTLHDMGPFTGGCHYSGDCERFSDRCGCCPLLGSRRERDLSRRIWLRKRDALAGLDPRRVRIVAPGRWLAEEARRSRLMGRFEVEVIPHGIDPVRFRPRGRGDARRALGIDPAARVVMFAAVGVNVPRKGMDELVAALRTLGDLEGLLLMVVGGCVPRLQGLPVRELGYVDDPAVLIDAYSAADVFAMPSLAEAFGLTCLEAQACGCPVAGFDVGGVQDIVAPDRTGLLVPRGDTRALAGAVRRLLRQPELARSMGTAARQRVSSAFTLAGQAGAYRAVYDALSFGSAGHDG
jgi:glycosyltransferase involved in cell wall biosynthesis